MDERELRLECLKLAVHDAPPMTGARKIAVADEYYRYVVGEPKMVAKTLSLKDR